MVIFISKLLYTLERTSIPNEQESGWVPELVWTFLRRQNSLALTRIWTPVCSLVTMLVPLPQLPKKPATQVKIFKILKITHNISEIIGMPLDKTQ